MLSNINNISLKRPFFHNKHKYGLSFKYLNDQIKANCIHLNKDKLKIQPFKYNQLVSTYLTKYDSFNSYDNFLLDTSIPKPNNNWLIYILGFIYFSSNALYYYYRLNK
jgi:hypothetical protein